MLNRITLVGRLTKEPELRKTGEDKVIVNFDIAVDNTMKEQDGTRSTCFLTCKVFGNLADVIANNSMLNKGDKVAIDGSIQQRNFVRKDGSKGHDYEVIVDSIEFCGTKPQEKSVEQEASQAELEMVQAEVEAVQELEPQFDPYTGKPLKKVAKSNKK